MTLLQIIGYFIAAYIAVFGIVFAYQFIFIAPHKIYEEQQQEIDRLRKELGEI